MGGDDFSRDGSKEPGGRKSGRSKGGGLGTAELSWLASALRQPGYKLPGVDRNGEPIAPEVVVRCLEQGLIEPWLPPRAGALPRVCRLTEKGEVIAENYLLCGEPADRPAGNAETDAPASQALEWSAEEENPLLDELLEDEGQAWWEALPGAEAGGEEPEVPEALPPLPRSASKPRRSEPATARQPRKETGSSPSSSPERETGDPGLAALRSLRSGARGPRRSAKSVLLAGVQLSGGLVLLAAGFALGWSIDPPFPRHEGLRISILEDAAPSAPATAPETVVEAPPRLEDILEIAPAAGPVQRQGPAFLTPPPAPAPSAAEPPPARTPVERSPAERLPALKDPDLMERWDRVDATPVSPVVPAAPAGREWLAALPPAELETLEAGEQMPAVERILLPAAPLSHDEPGYAEAPPRFGIELAAVSDAAEAVALRRALIEAHAAPLAGRDLVVEEAADGRAVAASHLIRSSALSGREEAERLCASLNERGQTCWVIELPDGR